MLGYCSCTCWSPSSNQNGNQSLSIVPSWCLFRCFLGIGSLGFSEFWHGASNPYHVVRVRAGFFRKTFFAPKIGETDRK